MRETIPGCLGFFEAPIPPNGPCPRCECKEACRRMAAQPEGLKFLWEAPRLLRQSLTCEASTTTILAKHYAENYFQLGWRIIPLKGKLPFIEGWQKARLSSEEFFAKWREGDNVGVVCGWLNDKFCFGGFGR